MLTVFRLEHQARARYVDLDGEGAEYEPAMLSFRKQRVGRPACLRGHGLGAPAN